MIKWLSTICALATLTSIGQIAVGVEFRVDTRVFRGGESNQLAKHTSWLTEQRVYDQGAGDQGAGYQGNSDQGAGDEGAADRDAGDGGAGYQGGVGQGEQAPATIFDFDQRLVILLDPQRGQRAQIEFDEILRFVAATTTRTTSLSKLVRFASAPKFIQQWDEPHSRLYLNHKTMSYSAELLAPPFDDQETEPYVSLYRNFTDWAARLNTMCPGLPPAARLKLNLEIYERHALPKSVRRTTPTRNGLVTDIVSRHTYQWQFSPEDAAQLAIFDDWEKSFQFVDYAQFRRQASASTDGDE